MDNAIGMRLNHDICGDRGVILIPNSTLIKPEHVQILEKHDITLTISDVDPIGPYSEKASYRHGKIIDDMVVHVSQLFEEVRETKKIPLDYLRREVIPMVHEVSDGAHLIGLFASLQAKDDYTFRHNIAVGVISSTLGAWMGLGQQELLQLTTAALLHDVGKMLISQDILNKPDKLTSEEYSVMINHTVLGYEIMKETIGVNHRQSLVALQHHERLDGSGYPFGSTKDKIDLFSRIVSVADIFHAMTSMRAYRNPSPFYEILLQMERDTFGKLDPTITKLFISKIMNCLIGNSVILTDGSEGIILMLHTHDLTRPVIQVGNGFVDLSKDLSIHIKQIL